MFSYVLVAQPEVAENNLLEEELKATPASVRVQSVELKIPSLQELIDSALLRSPLIKSQQNLINVKQEEISMLKKDWAKYLSLKTGVAYGTGGVNLNQASDALTNVISTNKSYRYDAGLYLSVSPSDLINRKNKMKIQQNKLDYEYQKQQEQINDLKQFISEKYGDFSLRFDLFKVYNSLKESSNTNLLQAKIDFENGNLPLISYNDILLKNAKVNEEFEISKNNLLNAKYILELTTGTQILLGPKSSLEPIF